MARISPINYSTASEEIKSVHDEYAKKAPMNNMKLTLLNNTVAFKALMGFHEVLAEAKTFLGELDANLFCYAISFENDCMVCSAIFKKFLDDMGIEFEGMVFTPVQQALVSFGRNIADNPHEVDEEQIEELKEFFTDEQIVVITSLAAMMIASNIINTVLDVDM
ncbi:MAG: hypothetical protein IKK85_10725 [Clostridia bacterium]|nr:hypothetical protein [Clostridia bacterium]